MKKKVTVVNSKAAVGSMKVSLNALPSAGRIWGAIAAKVGNDKYGFYNYRDSKVSYMMYLDAIERHLLDILDGEDFASDAPDVHHGGFIIAGTSIFLDAYERGNLIDDRPPKGTASETMTRLSKVLAVARKKVPRKKRASYLAKKRKSYRR